MTALSFDDCQTRAEAMARAECWLDIYYRHMRRTFMTRLLADADEHLYNADLDEVFDFINEQQDEAERAGREALGRQVQAICDQLGLV